MIRWELHGFGAGFRVTWARVLHRHRDRVSLTIRPDSVLNVSWDIIRPLNLSEIIFLKQIA